MDAIQQMLAEQAKGGAPAAGDPINAMLSAQASSTPQSQQQPPKQSLLDDVRYGLATGPIDLYLGAKQMFGKLDPLEQSVLQQNKQAQKNAPVSSFLSSAATLLPASFVPGANTVAGAGVVGAASGLLSPVDSTNNADIAKQKALSTVLGGGAGSASQFVGNKVVGALSDSVAAAKQKAADAASQNSVRDATLQAGREAGYTVPNSAVQPPLPEAQADSR